MAHGLIERRYVKAGRKGMASSSTALSESGQKRLDELKALGGAPEKVAAVPMEKPVPTRARKGGRRV
jgi:hypothetical protein